MSSFLGKIRNLFTPSDVPANGAEGSLAKVYGRNLGSPEALINRANKRAIGGDVDGAIEDFNAAIHLNPGKATAYFNRGFLYNTVGQYEAAVLDFSAAIELLPDYDEAYFHRANGRTQLGDLPGAIEDYSQALRINPFCIKAYYKRAEVFAEQGDHSGALADYSQAILNVPKDANAYYRRGLLLAKLGEPTPAIADFTQAITHNPKHADAYFNRGYCYAQLGGEAQAQQDFSQALFHDPNHEAAQYNRAFGLGILKATPQLPGISQPPSHVPPLSVSPSSIVSPRPLPMVSPPFVNTDSIVPVTLTTSAEAALERDPELSVTPSPTIKLDPESVEGYFERGHNRAINGDLAGAIADYSAIIDRDPHNTQAYYQRGQSHSALGEMGAAAADLEQALHWARMHSLGLLKDFSGELEDTIQNLRKGLDGSTLDQPDRDRPAKSISQTIDEYSQLIQQHPHHAQAYFERGQQRALLGDLEGAIADYSETLSLDPTRQDAYYKRGRARSALGDTQGATQDLNRAIRQRPQTRLPLLVSPQNKSILPLPTPTCDHAGNLPTNRFCIRCGAELNSEPTVTPTTNVPQGGDAWYQEGVALAAGGDREGSLKALAKALTLFLEQEKLPQYQETMKLMQQISEQL